MDRKAIRELHHKSITELHTMALKVRKDNDKVKLEKTLAKVKNIHMVNTVRHDLARILTVLREKELQQTNKGATQ